MDVATLITLALGVGFLVVTVFSRRSTISRANLSILVLVSSLGIVLLLGVWFFSNPSGLSTDVAVAQMTEFAGSILLLCLFTGVSAMATLEFVKRLAALRGRYQLRALREIAGQPAIDAIVGSLARSQGDVARRFDLPLGVLIGQLSSAVDTKLQELKSEADGILSSRKSADRRASIFRDDLLEMLIGEIAIHQSKPFPDVNQRLDWLAVLQSKAESSLDDLQTIISARWRWQLRSWACVSSAAYGLAALALLNVGPIAKTVALVATFVIGGYFSWLAHDLAALAEQRRK